MNATRAAAWPGCRTEDLTYRTGRPAQFRPDLRIVHRAGVPAAHARAAALDTVSDAVSAVVSDTVEAVSCIVPSPAPDHRLTASFTSLVPARHMTPPATKASPLRLTRRGRIVVAAMAALLVAGLSLAIAGAAQATGHSASSRASSSGLIRVIVRPGQTLWSVAENADPNTDPRQIIQQIAQLNALTGDTLAIGQRLWVPRS